MPDYRCNLYERLYAWLEARGVKQGSLGPEMAVYHACEFVETNLDMEAAVVVYSDPPEEAAPNGTGFVIRELPGRRRSPA
jgi:hypothetical protein